MNERKQRIRNIVLQAIGDTLSLDMQKIIDSRSRKREFIDARHIAAHHLYRNGLNIYEIGDVLQRTRVPIMFSLKRYDALYETDPVFKQKSDEIAIKIEDSLSKVKEDKPGNNGSALRTITVAIEPESMINLPSKHISPEEMMQVVKTCIQEDLNRQKQTMREKAARDKQLLRQKLSADTIFRITYIPFVLIEVAWDFADTIFDIAQMLRLHETKKLTRALREIRLEYDRKRFKIINDSWRKGEIENMVMFEECLSDFFSRLNSSYRKALSMVHGEVEDNTTYLITSTYICRTVLKALFLFTEKQEAMISSIIGYRIAPIVPTEIRKFFTLIIEFAGDKRLPKEFDTKVNEYARELVTFIDDMQLNENETNAPTEDILETIN